MRRRWSAALGSPRTWTAGSGISGLRDAPTRRTRLWQVALDAMAWGLSLLLSAVQSSVLDVRDISAAGLAVLVAAAILLGWVAGIRMGLYTGRWRYGSFEEVAALTTTVAATAALLVGADLAAGRPLPVGAMAGAGALALLLMAGVRYVARLVSQRARRPSLARARRVVVFGAGDGGVQAVTAMLRTPDSPYVPLALLDDDPRKANLRIIDVPVLGDRRCLGDAVRRTGANTLLIAIPSADAELVRTLVDVASPLGLEIRILPSVTQLFGGITTTDMRPVSMADLLGRREISTDVEGVAGYVTDRCVLVTGAGGSIGSELCRQVTRFGPRRLVMLDRDESALHAVQLSLTGRALLDDQNLVVADIRDTRRVGDVFAEYEPEVVFHAAALKHLPLLEMHPSEAVKTNVGGTLNLLEAASEHGVARFVNVSTDKAADPTSVLGYSKRLTERLTASFADEAPGVFLSVRFGNVLGSRGSVVTTFQEQIASGGPVTVTDPDVTRYFMTVEEAVQLVIQAGAIGRSGEALILDMGAPVRIADIAQQLVATTDRPVEIVYTGLRPGEKLHEHLLATNEPDRRPLHPLVSHVQVPPLDRSVLPILASDAEGQRLVEVLRWLADAPAFSRPVSRPGRVGAPKPRQNRPWPDEYRPWSRTGPAHNGAPRPQVRP